MSRTVDRADLTLPVTAEVGGEGGSFAGPTMQVATFEGSQPRHDWPMDEGHQPAGDTDAATGMRRYPTEAPGSHRAGGQPAAWRTGLVAAAAGAAAGAAVAFGLMKRRR